jgi:hypothetical protein
MACKSGCNYYLSAEAQRPQRKYFFELKIIKKLCELCVSALNTKI